MEEPRGPRRQVALTLAPSGADWGPGRQARFHRKVIGSSTERPAQALEKTVFLSQAWTAVTSDFHSLEHMCACAYECVGVCVHVTVCTGV